MGNKKAIAPVVATSLILVVAVLSVLSFQNWFQIFSDSTLTSIELQTSSENNFEIDKIVENKLYFKNLDNSNITISSVEISGINCNINESISKDKTNIELINCSSTILEGKNEIVIITEKGTKTKYDYLDNKIEKYVPTFRSLWNVGIEPAFSGLNNLQLPLAASGTYDFEVDWGDGTTSIIKSHDSTNKTHTYLSPGIYEVKIKGTLEGFGFNFGGIWDDDADDCDKLIDVIQWGNISLSTDGLQFKNCHNLIEFTAVDAPTISPGTSFNGIFRRAENFTKGIGHWDISNVNNIDYAFIEARSFNEDLNNWNISTITRIYSTFYNANSFNGNISTWDTSNINSMRGTFNSAYEFNGDISKWNTSSVNNMDSMFANARNFTTDISKWDVKSVTTMNRMFQSAEEFNGNISDWNTSSVTNMNGMFINAGKFNSEISNWDVSSVTNMNEMFRFATTFNQNISNWCVTNIGSEPTEFATNGAILTAQNKPIWGTCP